MSAANALSSDTSKHPIAESRAAEPSMEDILASIRRIIADDQSRHAGVNGASVAAARRPLPGTSAGRPAPEAATPPSPSSSIYAARKAAPAVETPRPGEKLAASGRPEARSAREGVEVAAPPPAPLPHLNPPPMPPDFEFDRSVIDEIASAGVAAALQPVWTPTPAPALEPVVKPQPPSMPDPAAAIIPPPTRDPLKPASRESAPVVSSPVAAIAPAVVLAAPVVVVAQAADHPDTPAPAEAPPAGEAKAEAAAEPLVSSSVDASVESSFNALATSVFLQNTGMVENLVRDMLKPMLKTWLESNLPTIVERLVRIEIERVARGGRG